MSPASCCSAKPAPPAARGPLGRVRSAGATSVPQREVRTKRLAIASGTSLVYETPASTAVEALQGRESPDRQLLLSDGAGVGVGLTGRLPRPLR